MAHKGNLPYEEKLFCSLCLDLLADPATLPCGHSYCMDCIKTHFDSEDERKLHSCPQCRTTFPLRPALVKNITLADLVEELSKAGLEAAPAEHCYAGPEDVACDACTGRKLKAAKSCLQCLVSYCETHLQPHSESPAFEKHKLVPPSKKLQENICSRHDEALKMFCRTDQLCICHICLVDDHRGHDVVAAATERTQRQKEVEVMQQNIQKTIQDKEKDVQVLQQEEEAINCSADKTVEESERIFTDLIHLLEKRRSDVKQEIRSQQEAEVSRVKKLKTELRKEMGELRREDAELRKLSNTVDHSRFLQDYPSLSALTRSTQSSSISTRPLRYFEDVAAAVSEVRDKLQDLVRDTMTDISLTVSEVDVLLSETQAEPKTRAGFFKYSQEITLDPNTANTHMSLSEENRAVTAMRQQQVCSSHPDRFSVVFQVLSTESLAGRCYWELEWSGDGIFVAVAYKNIRRNSNANECKFGYNDKSWALLCEKKSFVFCHNNVQTPVSGPWSSRLGVYLDHRAGILSFYSVSEHMILLHRVQTTFTQPLYAGVRFYQSFGDTAEFCKLK